MSTPPTVAVIGGGQLARMMQQSAVALGINLRALVEASDGSTGQVTVDKVVGAPADLDAVAVLIDGADVLTFEHEHIPAATMEEAARLISVQPPASALLYAQDKIAMRERLTEMGIPCPAWARVEDDAQLEEFARTIGWPLIVKTPRGGYDGHGVAIAHSAADVESWWGSGPLLAEAMVPFTGEVAALLARTPSGEVASWPVASTVQVDGVCAEVTAPAIGIRPETAAEARRIGERIASELGVTGVLAVEMFVVGDGADERVLVNELAMRPHNTGHWTIDGAVTSQFEQHLRAVLDLPLGSTELRVPGTHAVMVNLLGSSYAQPARALAAAFAAGGADTKVHLYGKEVRPGRKLGHVTVLDADPSVGLERARAAVCALRGESPTD
ncbi:MAG: 5-(carboxyamino)imidazole ribonucleotide synthase [Schaalia odontolytica]